MNCKTPNKALKATGNSAVLVFIPSLCPCASFQSFPLETIRHTVFLKMRVPVRNPHTDFSIFSNIFLWRYVR